MMKQIQIHGQRVELYSLDNGRTWSTSPQSIVTYEQRKTKLRKELQRSFERVDGIQDPDPNNIAKLGIPMSFIGR